LVPFEARRHVFHADDCPRALHGTFRWPNEKKSSHSFEALGPGDELDAFVVRPI
jgi:hypothetical protein